MSDRMLLALAGLATILIITIIIIALILTHLAEAVAFWVTIRGWVYGGLFVAASILAYTIGSWIYHKESTRALNRAEQNAHVKSIEGQTEVDKLRIEKEHEYRMAELEKKYNNLPLPTGHALAVRDEFGTIQVVQGSLAPGRGVQRQEDEPEELEMPIPRAPHFRDMSHLITRERMPLCWTIDGPAYGTIDDLLSMGITGKPGRGKTTALMYYVSMLLHTGAEVVVMDPHGAMAELAVLNGRVLPGLPPTARLTYLDRKEDIINAVPPLLEELDARDQLYRPPYRQTKHPLLLLADELPVLADYDEEIVARYKVINKQRKSEGEQELAAPRLITLIRRFVLEGRKWRCFFIGSGQSFDAEILPTKVVENFNSRIVFFSSDRRARMSGLENEAIKNLLPAIRRAGSGVMIFDCSRWDAPAIGAIPEIGTRDMLAYLNVDADTDPGQPTIPTTDGTMASWIHSSAAREQLAIGSQTPFSEENAFFQEPTETLEEEQSIEGKGFTMKTAPSPYSMDEMNSILQAAFALSREKQDYTRTDIMNKLGWTRKQWPQIKAVCDAYKIAPPPGSSDDQAPA